MPIKGKSKTTTKGTCWLFTKDHSDERKELDWYWIREAYEVSKIIHLLRHSQTLQREEDGTIQFWRIISIILQNQFPQIPHWSDDRWNACLLKEEEQETHWWLKNNCLFRTLQKHSGRFLIVPSLLDNAVSQVGFLSELKQETDSIVSTCGS